MRSWRQSSSLLSPNQTGAGATGQQADFINWIHQVRPLQLLLLSPLLCFIAANENKVGLICHFQVRDSLANLQMSAADRADAGQIFCSNSFPELAHTKTSRPFNERETKVSNQLFVANQSAVPRGKKRQRSAVRHTDTHTSDRQLAALHDRAAARRVELQFAP